MLPLEAPEMAVHQPSFLKAATRSHWPAAAALVLDFALALTAFTLFHSAYPDTHRSRLWAVGGARGWNSDPAQRIYFYANYESPPEVPLLWRQELTESALALATLTLVLSAACALLAASGALAPAVALLYDALLAGLWARAVVAQASPDYSDPAHPAPRPWYLTRRCEVVAPGRDRAACRFGRASFGLSGVVLVWYTARVVWAVLGFAYRCGERGARARLVTRGEGRGEVGALGRSTTDDWDLIDLV